MPAQLPGTRISVVSKALTGRAARAVVYSERNSKHE